MQIASEISDVQHRNAALRGHEDHEVIRRLQLAQHVEVLPRECLGRQRRIEETLLLGLQPRDFDAVALRLDLLLLRDLVVDRLDDLRRRLQIAQEKRRHGCDPERRPARARLRHERGIDQRFHCVRDLGALGDVVDRVLHHGIAHAFADRVADRAVNLVFGADLGIDAGGLLWVDLPANSRVYGHSHLLAGQRRDFLDLIPGKRILLLTRREEQYPFTGDQVEEIAALSSEQMGMTVDAGIRWQIDPQQAPRIYTEIGTEDQIHSAVRNAIRKGVRDAMVQYSINDIAKRTQIASTMERLVDSALVTQPRAGGPPFRIATVTAFFLRDLQPPAQVVQAINNKIAQEQQVETERHRVEVARLQAEQQRLLNTTLTPEALTRQYFDVLRELKSSNNLVILVPTQGGIPMLNIGDLRRNLRQP